MIHNYQYKKLTWIDLENPSAEEIKNAIESYSIPPSIARELMAPSIRPKVDLFDTFIYLILHFPSLRHGNFTEKKDQEIDFIIGKNFIITVRYDAIDPIYKIAKVLEVNAILDKESVGNHAGFLFYYMIKGMYESMESELALLVDSIVRAENNIFKGKEREMVTELSRLTRDILDFKRATSLHLSVLQSFESAGRTFFGESFEYHLRDIINEYYKVDNAIQGNIESIQELRDTNNALLSAKQNETMRILTIFAFLTLPFSVITSFFQMYTKDTPIIGMDNDWAYIMGGITVITLFLFIWAKEKKLL